MERKLFIIATFVGIISFASCKKEYSCEGCGEKNKPPVANAGSDQVISLPTDSVLLDGSRSSDPDGTISAWRWSKISGPASFNISVATNAKTVVKNLDSGLYRFELKVTDNGGLFAKDTIQIFVNNASQPNRRPVANAGTDQTITLPVNSVNLDGSGSNDPDNNITNYTWAKISGPSSFNIINANTTQTQVDNLVQGVYQFELKVTDAGGLFSKDTVLVTVNAQSAPFACDSNRPVIEINAILIGTLSQSRIGMAVASVGNKIVFAGASLSEVNGSPTLVSGSSRVDIYDIVTQTWSIAELSESRQLIAAVATGNKIFFAGGRRGDGADNTYFSNVDIYDVSTNTWSVSFLSEPRSQIAAAAVGNKVFFAGGENDLNYTIPYTAHNIVDIYDLSSGIWSTANLSEARIGNTAVAVNNKIYFAGGYTGNPNYTVSNKIDIYDGNNGSWSTSTLLEPKVHFAGISVADNIYWAGGGTTAPFGGISCKVEIKDVNTWNSSIAYLSQPERWVIDAGQNAVLKDDKIIFYRPRGASSAASSVDIYNTTSNTWSTGVLRFGVREASIISVNNTIYVAGGYVNGVLSNQVWKLEF